MRKYVYAMMSLPVILGAASCSSEKENGLDMSESNEIHVTTAVNERTRAGYTTENLRSFGLIIGTDDQQTSYHKEMTKNGSEWNTADGSAMYWASRSAASTVIAYAHYRADDINSHSKIEVDVETDQSTEAGVESSDFIAMKNGSFVPDRDLTADGKIAVAMNHMFGKVILNVQYPEFYAQADQSNPVSEITVDGLKVNAILDFDTWDGTRDNAALALDGNGEAATIIPYSESFDASTRNAVYEFIAVPQTSDIEVRFKVAGILYSWKYKAFTPKSGYVTTVNLTIDKQGVSMDDDVNVNPWGDGDEISGNPEEGADPFTVKEITDKSAWGIAYGFCSMPFGSYDALFDGNLDAANGVFTYVIDGMPNSPNLGIPFTVVDLGSVKWIAGAGVQVSFHDVLPKKVEFFVTDATDLGGVITDGQLNQLYCRADPNGDSWANSEDFRTLWTNMKTSDADVNWTKIGEVSLGALTSEWGKKSYNFELDESGLAAEYRSRYIKLVITPFSAEEASVLGGDRVKLTELFVKEVTARNGEAVK